MRSRLYELRMTEKQMEGKYRPDSRQLDMVRKQVEEGAAILEKEQGKPTRTEVRKGMNNAYQQMQLALLTEQSNISGAAEQARQGADPVDGGQSRAEDAQPGGERDHPPGQRNQVAGGQLRPVLQQAGGSTHRSGAQGRQDLQRQHPAGGHAARHTDRHWKVARLGLGLLLAIVGGVAFAFFCEYLDHSIKTPEDVHEKLQLPTLASIPQARANTVGPVWKSTLWKRFGIKPRQTAPVQWDLPATMRRHYAAFRERLLLSANGSLHSHYVLGVTSSASCEGVSTVAANLASSLSEQGGGSILLVDANTRDPSIHRIFRTRLSPGLIDVLSTNSKDEADDIIVRRAANLNVLTAGLANDAGTKAVGFDSLARYLESIKQNYRFVVVDMPALDEDGSAARLAGSCDGVILVVETERLRWETISKAKQHLQQLDANVLGVLLNKRRFPVPNWIYAAL